MKVVKRNGKIVSFDKNKIIGAINNAMRETIQGVDTDLSESIADKIQTTVEDKVADCSVEEIQDLVEEELMNSHRKDVARRYIIYRYERNKTREKRKSSTSLLTDDFLSQYKHKEPPMNQLGMFTYYRTYSRWLPEEGRREQWWETVRRVVEYNCNLTTTPREEAEELYDNIFNLNQFASGRTFWVGGTKVSANYPMANFNCAFLVIDSIQAFRDLFYLLMLGTGVGFRALKGDVKLLPKFKTNIEVFHQDYLPVIKENRIDHTSVWFIDNNTVELVVGDSKEGWSNSLYEFIKILTDKMYKSVNKIIINYNNVRPSGEKLNTFGGKASGHESIKKMFYKIDKIIKSGYGRSNKNGYASFEPINVLDICNIIGENVIVGGVRRTSQMALISPSDNESIQAKNNLFEQKGSTWVENKHLSHRKMSNNTIFYEEKPSREQLKWHFEQIKNSGEPGFVNVAEARKRFPEFEGLNPCLTGDMKILTIEGYIPIKDLEGKKPILINKNGHSSVGKVWCSGEKEIYQIKMTNKQTITCTENHQFMTNTGEIYSAKELPKKRLMPYLELKDNSNFNLTMIKLGFIQGDGNLSRLTSIDHNGIEINLGKDDFDVKKLFGVENLSGRSYYTTEFTELLWNLKFSAKILPERTLPENINEGWSTEEKLSFLRGLYSANGSVTSTGRITLKSTCKKMLEQVQYILKENEIITYITTNKKKKVKWSNGVYESRESYDLNIQQYDSRVKFYSMIGFIQSYKMDKLKELLIKQSPYIVSVKSLKQTEKVYDFSEPLTNWGIVEGFITHNCGEVLLSNKGLCNLVTSNVLSCVEDGSLNIDKLVRLQELNIRMSYRMSLVELELHEWNIVHKTYKLIGSSLTGWQEMIAATNISEKKEKEILQTLKETSKKAAKQIATECGDNVPILSTTMKPEGTLSLVAGLSSPGLHHSHSPFYIRRIRITATDPLCKVCEELEYPMYPEVGETEENCTTKVIEFPMKSESNRTKYNVTAIEQLETYKRFMQEYVEHNASITIHVQDHEWQQVEEWVWDHWDDIVAITFLSLDNSFYSLMPYESISEEEYNEREKAMNPFIPTLLSKYEKEETELDIGNIADCDTGGCAIR